MSQATEQPLGETLDFKPAARPERRELRGRHVTVRPLNPAADVGRLYVLSHEPSGDPTIWTYLYEGPHASVEEFHRDLEIKAGSDDPLFFVITDASDGRPLGLLSYLAIVPEHGTIEIGHIWFGPELKRTPAATEAIFLVAAHAFDDLGYRRLEWKCNALNATSRAAAERFGFVFEGVFLQHRVVKGRNRDTAWYAITDKRWPYVREAFQSWLSPENFEPDGQQRRSLRSLTANIHAT